MKNHSGMVFEREKAVFLSCFRLLKNTIAILHYSAFPDGGNTGGVLMTRDMTTGDPLHVIVRFTLPVFIGSLFQ